MSICDVINLISYVFCFFFQAEDGIRDFHVTGVQTCALPIYLNNLRNPIELLVSVNDSPKSKELEELAQEIAQLNDKISLTTTRRSEERRVGKECRSRWEPKQ